MLSWLTGTTAGKLAATFLISMVPVIELRGGLPYGIALGLPYVPALLAAVCGNMIPVPFVILYIRKVFRWLQKHWPKLDSFIRKLEERGTSKNAVIAKYGPIGLLLFVAIPLPGTGAWTGALVAAMLDIRLKNALPSIFAGVLIASAIMTAVTFGVIHIVL